MIRIVFLIILPLILAKDVFPWSLYTHYYINTKAATETALSNDMEYRMNGVAPDMLVLGTKLGKDKRWELRTHSPAPTAGLMPSPPFGEPESPAPKYEPPKEDFPPPRPDHMPPPPPPMF